MKKFDLVADIERANAAYFSLDGITIPASVRITSDKPTYGDLLDALLSLDELSAADWEEKYRPLMKRLKEAA